MPELHYRTNHNVGISDPCNLDLPKTILYSPYNGVGRFRGPKDHMNIRISHSGSRSSGSTVRRIPEITVGRILMFMFYFTILSYTIP